MTAYKNRYLRRVAVRRTAGRVSSLLRSWVRTGLTGTSAREVEKPSRTKALPRCALRRARAYSGRMLAEAARGPAPG